MQVDQIDGTHCQTIDIFKSYWQSNHTSSTSVAVRTDRPGAAFRNDTRLVFELETPGPRRFIYIDYYTLTGDVVHLLPSPPLPRNEFTGRTVRRFGDKKANWVIGPPFGTELIVAIASPRPLFNTRRTEVEKRDVYLRDLQDSLDRLTREGLGDLITADMMRIRTKP